MTKTVLLDDISSIPVKMEIVLGKKRITLNELSKLRLGDSIILDGKTSDPLLIFVNGAAIAEGELVFSPDGKPGVRVTKKRKP